MNVIVITSYYEVKQISLWKPMRLHNNQFPNNKDIYCANALINLEQASKNSIVQCLWSVLLSIGSSDASSRGSTAYKTTTLFITWSIKTTIAQITVNIAII